MPAPRSFLAEDAISRFLVHVVLVTFEVNEDAFASKPAARYFAAHLDDESKR